MYICVRECISVHVFFLDANIISRLAGNGVNSDIERNVCAVGYVCVILAPMFLFEATVAHGKDGHYA